MDIFPISAESRIYLFHNALDHNDSSALPGHFTRAIPNKSILACMVVEKSLTKNFHQKGTEGTDGRKNGRTDGKM